MMTHEQREAHRKAQRLHEEEERQKQIALQYPEGEERDEHWMRGERLSDEAWSIEEAHDIEYRPSGLWSPD
jgi:hypothetical protein